ncbi:MAG: PCP reductase family protein [Nitrospira sp.]|nr:PCP reductase family protein [Nitrospira sp.]MCP9460907.1 PCP reductase family protein [Nitrospira sp.]MCP9473852.1 PCP reductase family protein [Nitrospira sp.]
MKFVCLTCETYMTLEKVEKPEEGSLGVFFGCPSCNAKFSMVTNAGETSMMNALGLKLGARAEAADPTLASLADKMQKVKSAVSAAPSKTGEKTTGGCPFSAMVAEMGLTSSGKPSNGGSSEFTWTPDAKEKLDRLPAFVKPMVQSSVETYARKQGFKTITLQVMDDSKNDSPNGLVWSREAEQRLENIPDFIRPMARKEIERVARERGLQTVTAQVMDEAKEKFLKFM